MILAALCLTVALATLPERVPPTEAYAVIEARDPHGRPHQWSAVIAHGTVQRASPEIRDATGQPWSAIKFQCRMLDWRVTEWWLRKPQFRNTRP